MKNQKTKAINGKRQRRLPPATCCAACVEALESALIAIGGLHATMSYTPHFNRDHLAQDGYAIQVLRDQVVKLKKRHNVQSSGTAAERDVECNDDKQIS